jgi:NAD(P)-dependent dehydrogenase (short-subunit alcohol dehydrogenase family)
LELNNKVCVIAGASGAIGSAVVSRFVEAGAKLGVTYLSQKPEKGESAVGRGVSEFQLDINNWEQVNRVIGELVEQFGTIDVLVNCTGVLGPVGPTSSISPDEWTRAVEINLLGSFYLTRAVLPVMLAHGKGKIVHFSGGGAAYARPFCTAYSASKAALVRFAESLAEELRGDGIDVNTIAPGPVYSRMWDQMRAAGERGGANNLQEVKKMDETGGVSADQAAKLAVFLASEKSNGLTGRLISAIYDDWSSLDGHIGDVMKSEAGTLRRIPLSKIC